MNQATPTPMTVEERFWAYVDVSGDCWEWRGGHSRNGYGAFKIAGRQYTSHRCAWAFHVSPVPDDLLVLHRCDNRSCCNPAHLFLGTTADNIADMVAKGRNVASRGEKNGAAKLTWADVGEIRRLYAEGSLRRHLAERFGVTTSAIGLVVRQKNWAGQP